MNAQNIVEAHNLTKRFGSFTAVNGIQFAVRRGECVGFLGPNGAGKTTTVRMVSGFSPITDGTVLVFGLDVGQHPRVIKRRIGVCPQEENLDPDLGVEKNLSVYARYFDIPKPIARERADALLELMQLTDKRGSQIDELSGGMKRRLLLARSLLNEPELLILDEPTTGLDPQARHLIWQRVRRLRDQGTSILLTTHYMEEASQLCDRVILMDFGKILLEGNPTDLVEQDVGKEVVELWRATDDLKAFVNQLGWTSEEVEDRLFIQDREGGVVAPAINERFPDQERLIRRATLEDVFLLRTGRALKE